MELTGNSIYEYIDPTDHDEMASILALQQPPLQHQIPAQGGQYVSDKRSLYTIRSMHILHVYITLGKKWEQII